MEKISELQRERFKKRNFVTYESVSQEHFKVVGSRIKENERLSSKPYSYWKTVGLLLLKSPTFMISISLITLLFIGMFVFAPIGMDFIPEDRLTLSPAAPSAEYIFGLGIRGEDYFPRIWGATRTTLLFALALTSLELVLGVLIGLIWGYFRKTDIFVNQVIAILSMVPQLMLILFVMFLFKEKSLGIMIFAITLTIWIGMASMTRVQVILVKNTDYNTASKIMGTNSKKIIGRNILPRILPIIAQSTALSIPAAIGFDSTLTFLGFGYVNLNDTTQTSLGQIVSTTLGGTDYYVYPHLIIFPILMITIISVLFFLVGRIFADSLDPKNHR